MYGRKKTDRRIFNPCPQTKATIPKNKENDQTALNTN